MFGAIFKNTLQQSWREAILWSVGLSSVGVMVVLMLPFFEQMDLVGLLEALPPVMLAAFGIDGDLEVLNTPEGLIAISMFGEMMLIFCVYPVVMGLRVVATEEENGTMDVIMSLPVQRWQVVIEKFLAYTVMLALVSFLLYAGMALSTTAIDVELNLNIIAQMSFSLFPMLVFILAVTTTISIFITDRRTAMGVATAFVVASFIVKTVSGMLEGSLNDVISSVSFFTYFDASGVVTGGLSVINITVLMGIAVAFMMASLWNWNRRDIAV